MDLNLHFLSIRICDVLLVKMAFSTQHAISTSETRITFSTICVCVCVCDSDSQCEDTAEEWEILRY